MLGCNGPELLNGYNIGLLIREIFKNYKLVLDDIRKCLDNSYKITFTNFNTQTNFNINIHKITFKIESISTLKISSCREGYLSCYMLDL